MNVWSTEIVVRAAGWTLMNFLWEGMVIASVVAVALRVLRRSPAQWRYLAGCVAMVAMTLAPLVTFEIVQRQESQAPVMAAAVSTGAIIQDSTFDFTPGVASAQFKTLPSTAASAGLIAPKKKFSERIEAFLPWLVTAWLAGVCLLSGRLLFGWWRVSRMAKTASASVEQIWLARLAELAARLRVSRSVWLLQSALVEVPTVVGWLRPVILLPGSCLTGLTPTQLEAILAHELGHIRRHDYLVNLLQSAVETLLFYHPGVWWVSGKVREERENCCDDLAVAIIGDRVGYARALATLEELRPAPAQLAVAASGASLLNRIRRLAGRAERESVANSWPVAGLLVFLLLAATALSLRPHRAAAAETTDIRGTNETPPAGEVTSAVSPTSLPVTTGATNLPEPMSAPPVNSNPIIDSSIPTASAGNVANSPDTSSFETRTFHVDPTHFQAALEENLGKTVSSNGPPLTIKINGNGINRGLGGNQGAIGFASGLPTRMFQREDATSAIREYFKGSGIDLGTNSGRVVVCDLAGNTVTIRATKSELDVIAAAIQSLNQPPPEVNIKTKFVEFDDSGGNLLDNLAAGAPKITNAKVTPASVGLPGAPSQERSPAGATEGDATPSTITSILTDSQFRLLLRTFESRAGTKILTSPELTTENGRQGQMQAVDIQQIVTGFRGPGIVPTTTTMSFGPELDVVPYVDAARSNITLAIIPSIIDFVGYDNPGQFVPKIPGTNGGTITGVLPLPRFRLRQAVTSVTVRDGQTLVITGFASRDVVQTVKAKTPLLGSVPLLGRLFERQRTVTTKKGLAVFVTATIVNPDGTRYHRETADASPPPKDVK